MKYLTVNELSRMLGGRSRSSIYRDVKAGRLPKPFKYGALNYWRTHEVEAAVEALSEAYTDAAEEERHA